MKSTKYVLLCLGLGAVLLGCGGGEDDGGTVASETHWTKNGTLFDVCVERRGPVELVGMVGSSGGGGMTTTENGETTRWDPFMNEKWVSRQAPCPDAEVAALPGCEYTPVDVPTKGRLRTIFFRSTITEALCTQLMGTFIPPRS